MHTVWRCVWAHAWSRRGGLRITGLGLCLALLGLHGMGLGPWPVWERWDRWLYDTQLQWRLPTEVDTRIVIVDIDDRSLAEVGPWPWPRNQLADLSRELLQRQAAAVVGFDMVFPHPDDRFGWSRLRQLADQPLQDWPAFKTELAARAPILDLDGAWAQAVAQQAVVVGYSFTNQPHWVSPGLLPAPVMPAHTGLATTDIPAWRAYSGNTQEVAQAASAAGYFNVLVDADGVIRATPWLSEFQGAYYQSFPLALYRRLLGETQLELGFASGRFLPSTYSGLERLVIRQGAHQHSVPVDHRAASWVPFRGRGGPAGGGFRYVSAVDVLKRQLPPHDLAGKIVLVGTSAPVLQDVHPTPIHAAYPGVQVHASVLAGLLDGAMPYTPDYAKGFELASLVLHAALLIGILPMLAPFGAALFALGLLAANAVLHAALYASEHMVLPLASTVFLIALLWAVQSLVDVGWPAACRARYRAVFGAWVAPAVLRDMLENPSAAYEPGQRQALTVLVCQMHPPDGDAPGPALAQRVRAAVAQAVWAERGTLSASQPGCVLAFWGAPLACHDAAAAALAAARSAGRALDAINRERALQGQPAVAFGLGIDTGPLFWGQWGGHARSALAVLGPAVSAAHRWADAACEHGLPLLVGRSTREQAPPGLWQALDVAGPVYSASAAPPQATVYAPRWTERPGAADHGSADLRQELALWQQCRQAYRAQDWDACELALCNLERLFPAPLYALYSQRVRLRRQRGGAQTSSGLPVK